MYNTELIHHRRRWRHLEALEWATFDEWIDWFSHRRLLEPIGNVSPSELELARYHQPGELAVTA